MGSKFPDDWILSRNLRAVEGYAVAHGLDWNEIAGKFGIDPDLGHQRGARVPIRTLFAITEHTAAISGDDAQGFTTGSAVPVGFSSTFDYIAISAPSLRVGVQNWVRFIPIITNAFVLQYEERDGIGYLEWQFSDRHGPRSQFMFGTMSWAVTRILYITADPDAQVSLEFSCAEPKCTTEFQKKMGHRIRYNQAHDRVLIPGCYLSLAHSSAEPNLYSMVEEAALGEMQDNEQSDDMMFAISEQIGEALKNGNNTLENIAGALGMAPRSLQRKLAASGICFRDLTDEIRKSMAAHYLTDTNLPMTEIAFLLGFSDLSAFSRSGKNWFGVAPREYRRKMN